MIDVAFNREFYDLERLYVPDPTLEIEELSVEMLVTLHARLLYELPRLPQGTLLERRRGRRVYYSVQTTVQGRRREQYLSLKRNANQIESLKQKKAIRAALTRIRRAARHLKGYRRRLAAKQAVITRPYPENYVYYTNKIYVNSISEAAIVEILHKRHVKFAYGEPTEIGGRIIHPDFKYVVDGRTVYHEHLGKLDDQQYVNDWNWKHARYQYNNIADGTDLLISILHGRRIDMVEIEQMLHARGVF